MLSAIAIIEAVGLFVVGMAARAAFIVLLVAALAMPFAFLAMLLGWAGDARRRHFGHHAHAVVHARR